MYNICENYNGEDFEMGHVVDLTGEKFGKLTAIEFAGIGAHKKALWLCECECGTRKIISSNALRRGATKSCGCSKHGESRTRLWNIWEGMRERCSIPTSSGYKNYGGRGITVCDEWRNSYSSFKKWALSNGYRDDLTIDRIDVNGNYEPGNCRWSTVKVQNENKRNNRFVCFNGERHTVAGWAKILGINTVTLHDRLYKNNWTIERALTEPVHGRGDI